MASKLRIFMLVLLSSLIFTGFSGCFDTNSLLFVNNAPKISIKKMNVWWR